LVFILSPGSDPISEFLLFTQQGYSRKVESISLGQGQGIKAEKMIKGAIVSGNWILLQNCHLAITWMPELEKIVSDLDESVHNDFRLWLTSMPS
jgi:dynein heavy chain